VLQLDTGQVVSGIVRREDDKQLVLVDPQNKEIVVEAATIEDRFEGKSAMPEDVVKQITPRDLRDVIEFLSSLRTPNASGTGEKPKSGHDAK
jgi:quinoprotein glucose dehydrogenase